MSALDQALTKAYAKDRRTIASPVAETSSRAATTAGPAIRAHAIDQIYHAGVLYRVEEQAVGAQSNRRSVPAPHLSMLPPTSPRRAVRRSMLRMLAAHAGTTSADVAMEAPPRIARKVIIRHISHGVAPPPLG